jgi:hypothetical protein
MQVVAPASHLRAAARVRIGSTQPDATESARPEPAVSLDRLERAPNLPRELRSPAQLCREAKQTARMLQRLRSTWRSSERHAYLLHRAYLELAEHLLRDPDVQLPERCLRGRADRGVRTAPRLRRQKPMRRLTNRGSARITIMISAQIRGV